MYYCSNHGQVPKLSDLRDILRKKKFSHGSYDPVGKSAKINKQFKHGGAMDIDSKKYDPEFEK
jgi:hypothetical protein